MDNWPIPETTEILQLAKLGRSSNEKQLVGQLILSCIKCQCVKMRSTDEISSKQSADRYQVLCLLEKMPKGVFTFIRLFMLLLGFSTICLGALCVSTTTSTCRCGNNKLVFYCLLALGFFLLVTGIFWSTSHEVLKHRGRSSIFTQNLSRRELSVSTIDRPDFYPPSYEESTDPEKQISPLPFFSTLKEQEDISMSPPPYSKSSTELISETNEQEQPPPYELPVEQLQEQQTGDQDSDSRVESNSHPSTQEKFPTGSILPEDLRKSNACQNI